MAKAVPVSYTPPSRNQISGALLSLLYENLMSEQHDELMKDVSLFKLMHYLDGATVKTMPLLNHMASGVYNHRAVLDIIDCTGHMAEGGEKDATYIAENMKRNIDKHSPENAVLFAFDGASNVQKAGNMLRLWYPRSSSVHGGEHVCGLMFDDWFDILECKLLVMAMKKIRGNFGGSKHTLGSLTKKHSRNHHNRKFVGLLRASDTRMAGHAIAALRLLRLRPVIESVIKDPVYKQAKPPAALTELLNMHAFWHALYVIVRATFGPLRLLRLCDMEVAAMDKLYYFALKCQQQFREPKRAEELNTAAWDASHNNTEMYKWIHMYFCDGQKMQVPFSDKQAPAAEQVGNLADEDSDDDSDSDSDSGEEVNSDSDEEEESEPDGNNEFHEKKSDILQCRTANKYTLSQRFEWVYNQRASELMHPFSIAAWLCSPVPQVQETWKIDEGHKKVVNALIVKLYGTHGLNEPQTKREGDDLINCFWDEHHHFATKTGPFSDSYKWTSADILNNRSHFWHAKNSVHCTSVFGKLACVVTSKIIGIGNAERQWRDVKQLKQGQRSHLSSSAVRMQATLYGDHCAKVAAVRRDRIIAAKGQSKKGLCLWEDKDLDACGLDAFGIDIEKQIEKTKPSKKIQFKCWREEWEDENAKTKDPVITQKFLLKYKHISWLDIDNDVILTHHPKEMAWASAKPAGIAAFGLKEGYDMELDKTEDQVDHYEIWVLNEDFYDCVTEFYKRFPNPRIEIIQHDDFYAKDDSSTNGSSTRMSSPDSKPKSNPKGKPKRGESDSESSDDESSNEEEDTGQIITDEQLMSAQPTEIGKPRWARCFRCTRLFVTESLIVHSGKVFHSQQCLAKFQGEIPFPTPKGADLASTVRHEATPRSTKTRTHQPQALSFDPQLASPVNATLATAATAARAPALETPPRGAQNARAVASALGAKERLDSRLKAAAQAKSKAAKPRKRPNVDDVLNEETSPSKRRSSRKR